MSAPLHVEIAYRVGFARGCLRGIGIEAEKDVRSG